MITNKVRTPMRLQSSSPVQPAKGANYIFLGAAPDGKLCQHDRESYEQDNQA